MTSGEDHRPSLLKASEWTSGFRGRLTLPDSPPPARPASVAGSRQAPPARPASVAGSRQAPPWKLPALSVLEAPTSSAPCIAEGHAAQQSHRRCREAKHDILLGRSKFARLEAKGCGKGLLSNQTGSLCRAID